MQKLTFIILCLLLLACSEQERTSANVPTVFVITAHEQPYQPSRTYNARIESSSDVDIKAEVTGKLVTIHFKEGDEVKKDELLFEIDPKPYAAKLARAKSDLKTARTELKIAKNNYERGKKLVKDGYISELDIDKLKARKLKAESQLESFQATVNSAKIDMDHTTINAPIAGRIGRSAFSVGDLVGPDSGALTTLVGQNDMQVVFELPERLILRLKNPDTNIAIEDIVVSVKLEDETEYTHKSKIDYVSNRVDPATGTIETRANIPNPNYLLRPGMFVRAILRLKKPIQSLVIPQAAVQVDQLGSYVLVVDSNDKVSRRNILTDDRIGENVVVISGLTSGERIIIRGIQKARPGDIVKVADFVPATNTSGSKGK